MQHCDSDGQMMLFSLEEADEIYARPPKRKSGTLTLSTLISIPYFHLDLSKGHVDLFGCHYWEFRSPWQENGPPLNTGAAPREPVKCDLSSILERDPDERHDLSPKACLGTLHRAKERGKPLPERLEWALMAQAGLLPMNFQAAEMRAYHINRRDEDTDLYGVAGTLMATSNMQMQTFINGDSVVFAANQREKVNCRKAAREAALGREVRDLHDLTGALQAQPGMKQQTFVAGFSAGAGAKAGSIGYSEKISPTLKGTASGNCMPSVLCLNDQGGSVMDCTVGITGTLRAQEHGHQPLVYENHGIDARYTGPHTIAPTLSARAGTGGNNLPLVELRDAAHGSPSEKDGILYARQRVDVFHDNDVASTESARQYKDATDLVCQQADSRRLIRRLTPLECERLQGFPDGWTALSDASDSARYRALGNSVAIPCVEFIMRGITIAVSY